MPTSTIDEELRVRSGVEEGEELAQQVEQPAADSEGAAGRGISEGEGDCHAWWQRGRSVERAATQRDEAAAPRAAHRREAGRSGNAGETGAGTLRATRSRGSGASKGGRPLGECR